MSTFQDRRKARDDMMIDILPPEDDQHHDKGKVIRFPKPFPRLCEVEDAHFVPVHGQNRRRETSDAAGNDRRPRKAAAAAPRGIVISDMAGAIEKKLLRLSPDAFVAVVASVVVTVFTLFGGFSLLSGGTSAEPGPAIDITHVTMTPQDANGMRVLLINGIVENRTEGRLAMPSIRAELMSGETVVASTLISTAASQIGGRESYGFSARVPHPGGKLPDLRLSLAGRGA
ncbi:hypothetical protein [Aliirhizobium smilacinae]|uniref:DUF3426 domain-containing protein n=1 Tax=Aliirhizobium smilacinae TaxID=1395944 RepID=A0A5C4XBA0_9HYPH|nr:hypothetical protein [Rhizobium smilacinae]TNM60745.1 hypothetical protein FHP24_23355 [Rhizobium smilacinae]